MGVAVGFPLLLLLWSKTEELLNARSDAGVLLGLSIVAGSLAGLGLGVYFALLRLAGGHKAPGARPEGSHDSDEEARPKSLFQDTADRLEEPYEPERIKIHRE